MRRAPGFAARLADGESARGAGAPLRLPRTLSTAPGPRLRRPARDGEGARGAGAPLRLPRTLSTAPGPRLRRPAREWRGRSRGWRPAPLAADFEHCAGPPASPPGSRTARALAGCRPLRLPPARGATRAIVGEAAPRAAMSLRNGVSRSMRVFRGVFAILFALASLALLAAAAPLAPNLRGQVMILVYHNFGKDARWGRSFDSFDRDLARLDAAGYRPV